jgi:nitronate monooxygenase
MLTTRLCKLLGIEFPIISAPLGPDIAGPDLVAAVSGAGGLGLMQAQFSPPADFRHQIRRIRKAADKPFGVCFILALPYEENLAVCLEEQVPTVGFFWGDATPLIERVHAAGGKVFLQVGSVEAARRAAATGVDVIIAQGTEAGGHVEGEVTTMALVPRIVDAAAPLPVVTAGGIADARGVVAALALGAEAVLGPAFSPRPKPMRMHGTSRNYSKPPRRTLFGRFFSATDGPTRRIVPCELALSSNG